MEGEWPPTGGFLLCLTVSLLVQGPLFSTGRANTFTINCSGFDQHGVNPALFQAIFNQKDFRPVVNYSIPTRVNISFTLSAILEVNAQLQLLTSFLWVKMIWNNPFISWNPKECGNINKLAVTAENLWLPDIFIVESWVSGLGKARGKTLLQGAGQGSTGQTHTDVEQIPEGLSAYMTHKGDIVYNKPARVTSICSLDIFYFPFDQQNCTLTFSSFIYTGELQQKLEVWEMVDTSHDIARTQGEWELLGISKATPKMFVGSRLFDRIVFFITLLLGYNVFLLRMNDLLPASGAPLISVYFALCLSLMVLSLLETIFITYLLHLATTQPPPMPQWLHSLLLHCTSPRRCCPTAPQKGNKGLDLTPAHLPGLKEPGELVGKELGPREAERNGGSGLTRAQLTDLWMQFGYMIDTFLFRLYLLFLAFSISTVIVLWNT
ncbi:hypothetical protein HPG69_007090 [Diceros bicornis minor]|uniref:Neurotransmitter-gated ion-channel ligand-binding domain-containing protein n=1 Tax=Diceros bicornis minor TaxID=77932 RepID=A0A7J7F2C7_DICBM|nr:hypothetical protein HPG69_007090 [Diceros bicornis minor]